MITRLFVFAMTLLELTSIAMSQEQPTIRDKIKLLQNKNIVQPGIIPSKTSAITPLFPADYDWMEYQRVRDIAIAIASEKSEEMWESLLNYSGERESQAYLFSVSYNGNGKGNWTVHTFCERLAFHHLLSLDEVSMSPILRVMPGFKSSVEEKVRKMSLGGSLLKWRQSFPSEKLPELQIRVMNIATELLAETNNGQLAIEFSRKANRDKTAKFSDDFFEIWQVVDEETAIRDRRAFLAKAIEEELREPLPAPFGLDNNVR